MSDHSKHSPLPWEGCNEGKCTCGQVWSIPGDFPVCTATKTGVVVHEHMADAPDLVYQSISPEIKQANAAYIVKACNAYPKLVEALKHAHMLLDAVTIAEPDRGTEKASAWEHDLSAIANTLRELGELP